MFSWYIKSYCNLRDHPKARKLARLLNTSANEARGVLHCLWWWSLSYAESGNLSRYDPEEIAEACDWHGDARQLLAALIESGFIDEGPAGITLHDWADYTGKLVTDRAAEKDRSQRRRNAKKAGDQAETDTPQQETDGRPEADRRSSEKQPGQEKKKNEIRKAKTKTEKDAAAGSDAGEHGDRRGPAPADNKGLTSAVEPGTYASGFHE